MIFCVKHEKYSKGCDFTVTNFHMVIVCQVAELYTKLLKSVIKKGGFFIRPFKKVILKLEKANF